MYVQYMGVQVYVCVCVGGGGGGGGGVINSPLINTNEHFQVVLTGSQAQ